MASPVASLPAARILLPFVAGIMLQRICPGWAIPLLLIAGVVVVYVTMTRRSRTPEQRRRLRSLLSWPLLVAALALGWLCAQVHTPATLTEAQRTDRELTGRIVSLEYTDFSMRMVIDLLDSDLPCSRILLSTRGCDYSLMPGDLVRWHADLHETASTGNPDEMDYATYLLDNRHIRYTQHLPLNELQRVGYSPTLATRLAEARHTLELKVFNTRLSPDVQRFIVALLLGNRTYIDHATRQEFAIAGTSHVLALSGLHISVIALMLWWLLFPLDRWGLRKIRLLITLAGIFLFAWFTGLSPSVLRSTIMTAFVFASLVFNRRSVSLNALAMSALVILVFAPSSLYSVGFQLSFITVGTLLAFGRLPDSFISTHKLITSASGMVLASIVAMLATVALTAHYFNTVSLMSVLANLLVLPVLPLFMVLGAVWLLATAAGLEWSLLDWAVDTVWRYIHWATTAVGNLPFSHLSQVYVSTFGVIAYFVVLALVLLWLYRRRYGYLLAAGGALVVLLAHSVWLDFNTPRQGLVFFNSFSNTPVMYYENGIAYVWTPDEDSPDSTEFSRIHAGFLARYSIDNLRMLTESDTLRTDDALVKSPYAHLMGRRLVAVGSGRWKQPFSGERLVVDDIIVTKRFHGKLSDLQDRYRFDRMIVSGAMYDTALLLHECDSLHVTVHNLATQGALQIP